MHNEQITVGFVPVMADLYNRLLPDLRNQLNDFCNTLKSHVEEKAKLNFELAKVCSTDTEISQAVTHLENKGVCLLVLAMVSYTPSGQIIGSLARTKLPLLVWPAQPMLKLDPQKYDGQIIALNHGVHGAMDLCNVLRKKGRSFGVLHGHYMQDSTLRELFEWAQAAKIILEMKNSNPANLGGHFEDMLDLQIGDQDFIAKLGVRKSFISTCEFINAASSVSEKRLAERLNQLGGKYDIDKNLRQDVLTKAVRHELALRQLLEKTDSRAVGVNFMTLCNDPGVADALHLAACTLMEDGFGYAGEGDWVTAMLGRGMVGAGLEAGFSEIFSVGYEDQRLVLRHWGEGNPIIARKKPVLRQSAFTDRQRAEFVLMDFEYKPGRISLININVAPDGRGQLIEIGGTILDDHLPADNGPRGVFRADAQDIIGLLDRYSMAGGSHHLVVAYGDNSKIVEKAARLVDWHFESLK